MKTSELKKLIIEVVVEELGRVGNMKRIAANKVIKEASDLSSSPGAFNDPVLVTLRASMANRKKNAEAQRERAKKRVYGKQRKRLEDQLWRISQDLKDAYADRRDIYDEMEAEAGEKGNAWSDKDANRYGDKLNRVDDKIEGLIKKRNAIEIRLAY